MLRRRPSVARRTARWSATGIALIGLAASLSGIFLYQLCPDEQNWVVLACVVPYLTLLACLTVPFSWFSGRNWLAGTASIAIAILGLPQLPSYLPLHGGGSGLPIVLMTSNLKLGRADAGAVIATAEQKNASVLAVQEMTQEELDRLKSAGVDALFPYAVLAPGTDGTGVGLFSKFPLTRKINYPGFELRVVSAQIDFGSNTEPVTIFSSHLLAPWPQHHAVDGWTHDLKLLTTILKGTSGGVIDAGDFNSTLEQPQFRRLLSGSEVTDGAARSGSLPVLTYPADDSRIPPVIGIDHVLVRGVGVRNVYAVSVKGSDHRGLITNLRIRYATGRSS